MDVIAVIPVNEPGLAARRIAGRPLLAHAIEQANSAQCIGRIAVITADDSLARLAVEAGAVVAMPAAASAGPADALRQTLATLDPAGPFVPSVACVLDPGFPLRTAQMIDDAIDHLLRVGADTLLSVHPLTSPIWSLDEKGRAQAAEPLPSRQRFVDNGAMLAVGVAAFAREDQLPAGRVVLFEVPEIAALHLRASESWLAAEALVRSARCRNALARLPSIRLLALDFDGVMTDNRVVVFEDGREAVLCSRGDGMGLELVRKAGFPVVVISKEGNPVVGARCRKLKIPCEQGVEDKVQVLDRIVAERQLRLADVAFFGNDVNDLPCMRIVGLAIAPADAHPLVLAQADYVTSAPGGIGAVREICDLLLAMGEAER